jgi:hypothetical protein
MTEVVEQQEIPLEKLVKVYLKMNQARSELKTRWEAEDKMIKEKMETIKTSLLEHCKQHDVESVRTNEGTFYRTVKTQYWTTDWEAMSKFIIENGVTDLLEKRIAQGNMKAWLEDYPDKVPPGLNITKEYAITIRRKT